MIILWEDATNEKKDILYWVSFFVAKYFKKVSKFHLKVEHCSEIMIALYVVTLVQIHFTSLKIKNRKNIANSTQRTDSYVSLRLVL